MEATPYRTPSTPDYENGQASFRCFTSTVFDLYSLGLYMAGWETEVLEILPGLAAYAAFALWMLVSTSRSPKFSEKRVHGAILLDQFFTCLTLGIYGFLSAPFAFIPAIASIGHGVRYGAKYAYISCAFSLVFGAANMYFSAFWSGTPYVATGVLLAICCLPAYAAALTSRLAREKRKMEEKATEFENAAKAAQKQLRERQAELAHVARLSTIGEMAFGIAHEINQPLTAILSYNQACIRMLRENESEKDEITLAMQKAAEQAKRAGEIITRLRSFVKKQATSSVALNLNTVVADALGLIEHGLTDNVILVETTLHEPLPMVTADPIQVEQVVLNLLRNAIDAMDGLPPDKKKIIVRTYANDELVDVEVEDSGAGVASDILPNLFNPFFTTKSNGMGLGLTISQSIIEAFNGQISARNAKSGGAIFRFSLPARANGKGA